MTAAAEARVVPLEFEVRVVDSVDAGAVQHELIVGLVQP